MLMMTFQLSVLNFISVRPSRLLFSLDRCLFYSLSGFSLAAEFFFFGLSSLPSSFCSTTVCLAPFLSPLASEALAGPGDGFPFRQGLTAFRLSSRLSREL